MFEWCSTIAEEGRVNLMDNVIPSAMPVVSHNENVDNRLLCG